MLAHLPILQVIVPLMAAPLCLLLTRPRLVWLFALIASGLAFLISSVLLQQVMTSGTIIYELGGWAAPWGIEYRIDQLNAFLLLIISAISTVVLFAAHTSISRKSPQTGTRFFTFCTCYAWPECLASWRRAMLLTSSFSWRYPHCRPTP